MKPLLKLVLLVAAMAAIAMAADKPDFSGDWKLNAAKSSFGPIPPPTTYTRKVTQSEPSITFEDTQTGTAAGDQHDIRTYTTDGKEISYQANGADVKAAMTWDGNILQINAKASIQGMELTITDKVTLGDDGKTMNDSIQIATGQGDIELKLVFDKQ
jgi:hypothetical protein